MLPFHEDIVAEAHASDSLHVVARGLGLHLPFSAFIASAVDESSLILALNVPRHVATTLLYPTLRDALPSNPRPSPLLLLPRYFNADYSVRDRHAVYASSGLVVLTSTILVHDLLHNTLPASRVKGILLYAADQLRRRSNDHFALSLFRARNRTAFIKAFSDNAPALAAGFHTVEKVMRMAYVSRLVLWPRFHHAVRKALRRRAPDLVDLAVPASRRVRVMVAALRDTVRVVLLDLKHACPAVDLSELYHVGPAVPPSGGGDGEGGGEADSGGERVGGTKRLVANFDDVVRRQVEGVGGSGRRVRGLVADVMALRVLLREVYDVNAVQFYQRVVTLRHAAERGQSWLVRREAQMAVLMARSRVWIVRRWGNGGGGRGRGGGIGKEGEGGVEGAVRVDGDDEGGSGGDGVRVGMGVGEGEGDVDAAEDGTGQAVGEVEAEAADVVRAPGTRVETVAVLEASPKWQALREVLAEIKADVRSAGAAADVGRVLVVVREPWVVDELRTVLSVGEEAFLRREFEEVFPSVAARVAECEAERERGGDGLRQTTITQLALPEGERRPVGVGDGFGGGGGGVGRGERGRGGRGRSGRGGNGRGRDGGRLEQQELKETVTERRERRMLEDLETYFGEVRSQSSTDIEVLLWCMEWVDVQGRGLRILDEYRPSFVVLYGVDLAFVRQVEVYKAATPGRPVRLYILSYDDSVDEERFRKASEREKAAFKTLIRERATMTIHVDQEGREAEDDFTRMMLTQSDAAASGERDGASSSRQGLGVDRDSRLAVKSGNDNSGGGGIVIVDTRELRSSLPMMLHQTNLKIVPVTLEVGDFILSRDIGVERKSLADLHGSFGSGRLFNQAEALCRHYKHACLLIELESGKALSLTAASGGVPSELLATSIVSKMVLLMLQFPTLRLLWARGPRDGAELFAKLKVREEDPDVKEAAALGVDTKEGEDTLFNAGPKGLLRSLPGIDSQNLQRVMGKVRNVATLVTMSMEELTEVLGSVGKAKQLYDFVTETPSEALAAL